jgi:hypothetical protein
MEMKINSSIALAAMAAVCLLTFGIAVPLGSSAQVILLAFAVAGFCLGYFNLHLLLVVLMVTTPIAGLYTNIFHLKSISILFPYCMFGALGRIARSIRQGEKTYRIDLPAEVWIYTATVLVSMVVGVAYFARFLPDFSRVVSHTPWGDVKLLNAFGWIVIAGVNFLTGLIVFNMTRVHMKPHMHLCIQSLLAGCFLSALLGIGQFQQWFRWGLNESFFNPSLPRYNAGSSDPNALGVIAALLFFLWLGYVIAYPREKIFYVIGLFFPFLMVIAGSRTSFLLIGVGVAMLFLLSYWRKKTVWLILCLFVIFLGGMLVWSKHRFPTARSYEFVHDLGALSQSVVPSASNPISHVARPAVGKNVNHVLRWRERLSKMLFFNRIPYWENAWSAFKHHPILGCGYGTYLIRAPQYARTLQFDGNVNAMNENACNMYLQIAAEQGVLGLLAFVFWMCCAVWTFLRKVPSSRSVLEAVAFSAFAGLLVAFLVGVHIINPEVNILFWLLMSFFYPMRESNVENRS